MVDTNRVVTLEEFLQAASELPCVERATAYLDWALDNRPNFDFEEAIVFKASRGEDIRELVRDKVMPRWTSEATARNDDEHFSSLHEGAEATFLRTMSWCGIGEFNGEQRQLVNNSRSAVAHGEVCGSLGSTWLADLCRADRALRIMPDVLTQALDSCKENIFPDEFPWMVLEAGSRTNLLRDFRIAATLTFSDLRLCASSDEFVSLASRVLLSNQSSEGYWCLREDVPRGDVLTTAFATHALALAKPRGWSDATARAVKWLQHQQAPAGNWNCPNAPDGYSTVLILDAMQLADNNSQVSFRQNGVVLDVPVWDRVTRELRWNGQRAKRFRSERATQVFRVLDAFQQEGWPTAIDSPLDSESVNSSPRRLLQDTLTSLNRNLSFIEFLPCNDAYSADDLAIEWRPNTASED